MSTLSICAVAVEQETGRTQEDLLAQALAGSAAAWRALVAEYGGLVRATATRFRLQPSDVDEVVQTTWLRLLERGGSLRDARCLPGWLATTASREALRLLTSGSRSVDVDPLTLEATDGGQAPEDVVEVLAQIELSGAVRQVLAGLPDRWRVLLQALMAEDRPDYGRVSRELGMPVGSIGPTRGRALSLARRRLEECGALA